MQPAPGLALAESVGLVALLVPLGAFLLRLGELWRGRSLPFTPAERILLSFYAAGLLFYVIASLPVGLYYPTTIVVCLIVGAAGLIGFWWRERFRGAIGLGKWIRSGSSWLLLALVVTVLAVEFSGVASFPFPNAYDGSFQTLLITLISRNHSVPWTLSPYGDIGILYPAGAAVWMTAPVWLFGWAASSGPVDVPLLFLALSVVGAYCWGERLAGPGTAVGVRVGLVVAAVFALVGSWPRWFIGGSYDFVMALPLAFVVAGWLWTLSRQRVVHWAPWVLVGLAIGTCTTMSLVVGESLLALLLGLGLYLYVPLRFGSFVRLIARFLACTAIAALFVTRSLFGLAAGWGYPSRTVQPVGQTPYASIIPPPPSFASQVNGYVDPFFGVRLRLSPIPALGWELEVLIAMGAVSILYLWYAGLGGPTRVVPSDVVRAISITVVVFFVFVLLVLGVVSDPTGATELGGFTNPPEVAAWLFIAYQLVAAVPLIWALEYLVRERRREATATARVSPPTAILDRVPSRGNPARRPLLRTPGVAVAALLLVVAFGAGAAISATSGPSYLNGHFGLFANVTQSDVDAMEWAGSHLPSCSRVLVAPGSAGQYLPTYATITLLFPMIPTSVNLSYFIAISNLTSGRDTPSTASALLTLGVTEVFATGQTSVSYPAFQHVSFVNSTQFELLYSDGDASVYGFLPGLSSGDCTPVS